MGSKKNPGKYDAYTKAEPDEPTFTLLARDPQAPGLVRRWAERREQLGEEAAKVAEARSCADAMEKYQLEKFGLVADEMVAHFDLTGGEIVIAADTMSGDLRDVILTQLRLMSKPWEKLSESEQRSKISDVTVVANDIMVRAVDIVAQRGFDHVPIKLGGFRVKGSRSTAMPRPSIERMEAEGIVSPVQASGRRKVLRPAPGSDPAAAAAQAVWAQQDGQSAPSN